MKVEFTAVTRLDEKITSHCIIQKYINKELIIYLGIKGHWKLIKNETLEIKSTWNNQNTKEELTKKSNLNSAISECTTTKNH